MLRDAMRATIFAKKVIFRKKNSSSQAAAAAARTETHYKPPECFRRVKKSPGGQNGEEEKEEKGRRKTGRNLRWFSLHSVLFSFFLLLVKHFFGGQKQKGMAIKGLFCVKYWPVDPRLLLFLFSEGRISPHSFFAQRREGGRGGQFEAITELLERPAQKKGRPS